jgi:hypothetical protein
MSFFGTYRLINQLENGALTGAQLQSEIAGSDRRLGEFTASMDLIQVRRRLGRNKNAIAAIAESAKALEVMGNDNAFWTSVVALPDTRNAILSSPTRMQAIGNTTSGLQARFAPFWAPVTRNASAFGITEAAWSGQNFVTLGQGTSAAATSPDGITWTARTKGAGALNSPNAIASKGDGNLIAACNNSSNAVIIMSTDHGATWTNTATTTPGNTPNLGFAWFHNHPTSAKYWGVLTNTSATTGWYASDGNQSIATWTALTASGSGQTGQAFFGPLGDTGCTVIASAGNTNNLMTSINGISFNNRAVTGSWSAGAASDTGIFVAGSGTAATGCAVSTDPHSTNWTTYPNALTYLGAAFGFGKIAFGGGMFVATPSSSSRHIWFSTNGSTWTVVPNAMPVAGAWEPVFGGGLWFFHYSTSRVTNF